MVTLLTGENLNSKKSTNISYSGILNAACVDFERITTFHAKYEKKWTEPVNKRCQFWESWNYLTGNKTTRWPEIIDVNLPIRDFQWNVKQNKQHGLRSFATFKCKIVRVFFGKTKCFLKQNPMSNWRMKFWMFFFVVVVECFGYEQQKFYTYSFTHFDDAVIERTFNGKCFFFKEKWKETSITFQ